MKRALQMSIGLALVLVGARAFADSIPEPKYLADPERHWFAIGGGSDGSPKSLPIVIHFDNSTQDNLSNQDAVDGINAAFAQWQAVPCTNLPTTVSAPDPANHLSWVDDGQTTMSFNDPAHILAGLTLAATITWEDSNVPANIETVNGHTWRRISNFDIVWARDWSWVTRAQDTPGSCTNQVDFQSVAVHEIGHGLGYAHSCEANQSCADPLLRDSIMYWVVDNCHASLANAYDNKQHSIAYGIGGTTDFTAAPGTSGPLPFAVTFSPVAVTSGSIVSATWNFGDGNTSMQVSPTHTYLDEGRYSVQMDASETSTLPECGAAAFPASVRKVNYITACNDLVAAFHYSTSGKSVHFFSETLGAATGCLNTLTWDFGDGTTGHTREPIHTYAQGGQYTVTLTASGPAGDSAPVSQSVSTGGGSKGCSVDGVPDANMAAAIGALGAAVAMCFVTLSRRKNAR